MPWVVLGGHAEDFFALRVVSAQPVVGFGGDLDGADGPRVVGVDGDAHGGGLLDSSLASRRHKFNTDTGRHPDRLWAMLDPVTLRLRRPAASILY
jgi:hypothetical protein